jgi:hypothetical protein
VEDAKGELKYSEANLASLERQAEEAQVAGVVAINQMKAIAIKEKMLKTVQGLLEMVQIKQKQPGMRKS